MTTSTAFAQIALARIVPSLTNPRRHFDAARLAELAESIRASGVHQPVLLRPLPGGRVADTAGLDPRPEYELVSGERRWRASQMAGADSIAAVVRPLTDSEVLDIQLVENLQREDLQPLEEAQGYERLMHAHEPPLSAEQIGQRIGKSRSYVYGRLKLLNLGPEGQQAMQEGWLDASTALLLARMPSSKLQAQALGNLRDYAGRVLSHREASALIERQYMLKLGTAAWKITDATLLPAAGSCRECAKRTGADPDLFADIKGADVCTDPPCFQAKTEAHQARSLKTARDSGATIIDGREARQLMPHSWSSRIEGYLRLDDKDDAPGRDKTLRQLIGQQMEKAGVKPVLLAHPHRPGELVAVITHEQARELLAAKGYEEQAAAVQARAAESDKAAAAAQQQKDKERFERGWRWAVLEATWAKVSAIDAGLYRVPDDVVRELAVRYLPNAEGCKRLAKLLELGPVAPAEGVRQWVQEQPEPHRALALMLLASDQEWAHWRPEPEQNRHLLGLANGAGIEIDIEALKAAVKKQHAAEIRARNKVQADKAADRAASPSKPLAPAAQANGGRGRKSKNAPAAPAGAAVSEAQARTGIAAAMQGDEGGADDGPAQTGPAGGDAAGADEGRATAPDAGATRSRFVSEAEWPFPAGAI